jgi:hypothetical protein
MGYSQGKLPRGPDENHVNMVKISDVSDDNQNGHLSNSSLELGRSTANITVILFYLREELRPTEHA